MTSRKNIIVPRGLGEQSHFLTKWSTMDPWPRSLSTLIVNQEQPDDPPRIVTEQLSLSCRAAPLSRPYADCRLLHSTVVKNNCFSCYPFVFISLFSTDFQLFTFLKKNYQNINTVGLPMTVVGVIFSLFTSDVGF